MESLDSNRVDPEQVEALLNDRVERYETPDFVADDPISVPHSFARREDIEISGLLASTIAWGNRKAIVKKAHEMMTFLDNAPFEFTMNASAEELKYLDRFVYRTFQKEDLEGMVLGLRNIYKSGSLENVFALSEGETVYNSIARFRAAMLPFLSPRTHRHIANVEKGSAAKRINMFLRWMVRSPKGGVDFGLWKSIKPSQLMLPLDVHSGNVSRSLGLLSRKQDDWRAVEEVTAALRRLSPDDPTRYDFALFGLGIFERWK